MTDSRSTFLSAADSFVAQAAAIPLEQLDGPGLGAWSLRALVDHTSRSLVTVDTYLDQPAEAVDVPTAADYYLLIAASGAASGDAVTERGRQAGDALGDDPARFVADLAVHGLDIGRACGVEPSFDEAALLDATTLATEVAVRSGQGPGLLAALTGRGSLPAGFTVV